MRKARFTKQDVRDMLNSYMVMGMPQKDIAAKYGAATATINSIMGYYRSAEKASKQCPLTYRGFIDEIKKERLEKITVATKIGNPFEIDEAGQFDWRKMSGKPVSKMGEGLRELRESAYHSELKGKVPHKCPVCDGRGFVPGGFYGNTTGNWSTSSTAPETCRSCVNGIIWG